MLALCAAKVVATVFSYASGGAGGIFAPSLFIGGTLGGALGTLDSTLLGHASEPVGAFALVGMGAVFAGIIRAPMTSVLIIVEMTGGYSLILPLMIANMTAYVLARHFRPTPIYEALLVQDGIRLEGHGPAAPVEGIGLDRMIERAGPFPTFSPNMPAKHVVQAAGESRPRDTYPVVDREGKLVGIITAEDLTVLVSEPELIPLTTASDIMRTPTSVHPEDDARSALDAMLAMGAREVSVTDHDGHFLGFVNEATIAHAYLRIHRRGNGSERPPERTD
jgi:CIC family chloride channel protein